MRSKATQFFGNSARILAGTLLLLVNGSARAQQQNPPTPPRVDSRAEFEKFKVHKKEMEARETDVRLAEKGAREIDGHKESLTMKRVTENFARLQTVTNEIVQAVKNDPTVDYLHVKDAMGQINKCAQRLKSDLVFPETKRKNEKQDDSDDTDVRASVIQLDVLVKGFVTNTFLTKGLQDEALGAKASRDLDHIIAISNSIRKHAQKLSRTSLKP